MKPAPLPCLNCQPNPDATSLTFVCDLTNCLRTLQTAKPRPGNRRISIPTRRYRQADTDPEPLLEDETEPEADTELDAGAVDPMAPARPVRNRAGQTVMARAGRRACDHRCQFARGRVCVCRCGGRNHGVGAV